MSVISATLDRARCAGAGPRARSWPRRCSALMFVVYAFFASLFSSFTIQALSNDTAALALAAVGETLVVLTGGFDLSVGAIIGLVNVLLATHLTGDPGHDGLLAGTHGADCGRRRVRQRLAGRLRAPAVDHRHDRDAVHLQRDLAQDLDEPGGAVPRGFEDLAHGRHADPRALIIILLAAVAWLALRRTRLGAALYAIGGDRDAARMSGIPIERRLLATYTLAGVFYGLAAIFYTAPNRQRRPRDRYQLPAGPVHRRGPRRNQVRRGRGLRDRIDHRRVHRDDAGRRDLRAGIVTVPGPASSRASCWRSRCSSIPRSSGGGRDAADWPPPPARTPTPTRGTQRPLVRAGAGPTLDAVGPGVSSPS